MKKDELVSALSNLTKVVESLKEKSATDITTLKTSIDNKKLEQSSPIHFEDLVLQQLKTTVNDSLAKAIRENLLGYSSPLTTLVAKVVTSRAEAITKVIEESLDSVITTEEFRNSLTEAFKHKVARNIISNNESMLDKIHNDLKNNPVFKAKLMLAIDTLVAEFNSKKE